jgi:hypothetical protein
MKVFKSLKFRFALLFSLIIIAICLVNSFMAVKQTADVASNIFAAEGVALVQKGAALFDGDIFEALAKSLDSEDPYYIEYCQRLLELKQFSS